MGETTADQFSSANWRPPGEAKRGGHSRPAAINAMIHPEKAKRRRRKRALLSWPSFLVLLIVSCLIRMSDCLPTSAPVDSSEETLQAKGRRPFPIMFHCGALNHFSFSTLNVNEKFWLKRDEECNVCLEFEFFNHTCTKGCLGWIDPPPN